MSYSIHSTLRDLLSDEQAKAILERHLPGASSHPDLPMAMQMTLNADLLLPGGGAGGRYSGKIAGYRRRT